jgi:two-component system NtrC family response regulator
MLPITLLIIDDDPAACRIFKKILGQEGYHVLTATDAGRGLRLIKEKSPEIVFLDIKMPRIDGIELLRRIRKINKDVIVIMLTGFATLDTARKAMELGAHDYVTKPFDLEAIKASIRDALEVNASD